jgi:hypothetical protein
VRGIVALNIFQLSYFNLRNPSVEKILWSVAFSAVLFAIFWFSLARMRSQAQPQAEAVVVETGK